MWDLKKQPWLFLHPWVYTYGPCNVHTGLHLAKKVIYMPWEGGQLTQRHWPLWACVAVTEAARPPAWRQLGSGFYIRRPPWKALIDWRLIFLTGSWNPATKTTEQRRGSGGATKLLYDREGERQGTNVQGKERKMSLLMFVRWYRLCGSNLGLVFPLQGGERKKKGTVWEREHRSEQKWKRGGKLSIKLYLFPVDFHSPQNMNIHTKSKRKKII